MSKKTHCQTVLTHLRCIGPLTQWQAIRHYRITRLGARIWDLRRARQKISDRWVHRNGKRFKEYAWAGRRS